MKSPSTSILNKHPKESLNIDVDSVGAMLEGFVNSSVVDLKTVDFVVGTCDCQDLLQLNVTVVVHILEEGGKDYINPTRGGRGERGRGEVCVNR